MAQTLKLKRSSTQHKVPGTSDVALGELAINTYDGRVFFKKNDGSDSIEHIVTTDSITTGSISLTSKLTSATLTLSGLSAQNSEATSLMINGSGVVGTRELGSNAFNSTGFTTNTGTVDTSGTPVDNDFAKFTDANTIEGRNASETKTDLSLNNVENTAISTFAGSTNITTLGTIGTGTWQGTAISTTYLSGQSGTNTGDETKTSINALDITEVGTIDSGVWNGTAIASAYLDSDTAHLSTTQTFSGAKTFSSPVSVTNGTHIGLTIVGSGTSHTQGAIALKSSTSDTPAARGQGVFMFNEGDDSTFYMGTQYQDADTWQLGRATGAYINTEAAESGNAFLKISNAGAATFNGGIANAGTIAAGTWNGTAIASAYLDSDTAHLSGTQTFSGTKTFTNESTHNGGIKLGNDDKIRWTSDDVYIAGTTSSDNIDFVVGAGSRFNISQTDIDMKVPVNVDDATQSTTKTTGCMIIDGGVGIAKTLNVGEDVVAYASSDERYKDNIIPIRNPNEKIKQIGGYTFDWNDKHEIFKGKKDIGVVAQEIEKVLPEIVETRDNGYKAVKYEKIVALLIESNKELIKRVEELESKIK